MGYPACTFSYRSAVRIQQLSGNVSIAAAPTTFGAEIAYESSRMQTVTHSFYNKSCRISTSFLHYSLTPDCCDNHSTLSRAAVLDAPPLYCAHVVLSRCSLGRHCVHARRAVVFGIQDTGDTWFDRRPGPVILLFVASTVKKTQTLPSPYPKNKMKFCLMSTLHTSMYLPSIDAVVDIITSTSI